MPSTKNWQEKMMNMKKPMISMKIMMLMMIYKQV